MRDADDLPDEGYYEIFSVAKSHVSSGLLMIPALVIEITNDSLPHDPLQGASILKPVVISENKKLPYYGMKSQGIISLVFPPENNFGLYLYNSLSQSIFLDFNEFTTINVVVKRGHLNGKIVFHRFFIDHAYKAYRESLHPKYSLFNDDAQKILAEGILNDYYLSSNDHCDIDQIISEITELRYKRHKDPDTLIDLCVLNLIMTTPFAARVPQRAAADAPFKTSIEAMSSGLISLIRD